MQVSFLTTAIDNSDMEMFPVITWTPGKQKLHHPAGSTLFSNYSPSIFLQMMSAFPISNLPNTLKQIAALSIYFQWTPEKQ